MALFLRFDSRSPPAHLLSSPRRDNAQSPSCPTGGPVGHAAPLDACTACPAAACRTTVVPLPAPVTVLRLPRPHAHASQSGLSPIGSHALPVPPESDEYSARWSALRFRCVPRDVQGWPDAPGVSPVPVPPPS